MLDEEVSAVLLALIVVGGVFALAQALRPNVVEPFSEIGVLGPKGKIGDYPRAVVAGEPFRLYLYVGNHEGRVMYYLIYVKLGNRSTVVNSTAPARAPVIASYELILPHGRNATLPVTLSVDRPASDARLIFELWALNASSLRPVYWGRWLQLWLNVTAPPRA